MNLEREKWQGYGFSMDGPNIYRLREDPRIWAIEHADMFGGVDGLISFRVELEEDHYTEFRTFDEALAFAKNPRAIPETRSPFLNCSIVYPDYDTAISIENGELSPVVFKPRIEWPAPIEDDGRTVYIFVPENGPIDKKTQARIDHGELVFTGDAVVDFHKRKQGWLYQEVKKEALGVA